MRVRLWVCVCVFVFAYERTHVYKCVLGDKKNVQERTPQRLHKGAYYEEETVNLRGLESDRLGLSSQVPIYQLCDFGHKNCFISTHSYVKEK